MKYIISNISLLLFSFSIALSQPTAPNEMCEGNSITKLYSNYHLSFLTKRSGVDVKNYGWNNDFANCRFNLAEYNHRKTNAFLGGGFLTIGIGAGLIIAGGSIAKVKVDSDYNLGSILLLSGIGAAAVSIPLFVIGDKYRMRSKRYAREAKNFFKP